MPMNAKTALQEFHVARAARDRYQFDESLYATNGEVIFANFHAARVFAQHMNQKRDLVNFPEQAVRASQINALGLIHEVSHHLIRWYRSTYNPNLLSDMLAALTAQFGAERVDAALTSFADEFPPLVVYRRETTVAEYLAGATDGTPNRELLAEELLLLWLANSNPAFAPFQELFDDATLERETAYPRMAAFFTPFFSGQPQLGPGAGGMASDGGAQARALPGGAGGQSLLDLLLAPVRAHPHSLEGQLEFVRQQWGSVLGRFIYRVLGSLDLIHEEEKPLFIGGGFDSASIPIPHFERGDTPEVENFTLDREWMPQLVMIAKNAYVWLDQLTKAYARPIRSLAEIPDEELDKLARWGVTGLWLIGLWERSEASKTMKQMMGNPDAVASAYSLYDYEIAQALGGAAACDDLRARAWQRGIRLASDMVPNHVGIDGRWVVERPDFFVQNDYSPFPSYTFNGPNLSPNQGVGLYLEDHYYDKTDAAVVFKRVDHGSGRESYIYHGNDGTSMPWNDTAQLNYLHPEVREHVIQTILNVARQFPIIRFDAAMTLAKKHFQRLWFPEPGTGGDIASRAEFGMTRAEFDRLMPQEFWREVVDRAAVEAPDTLLLAEAFWLMESYFVRTLGMHRVYNSAFMHILRDEENGKYRQLMKNTLEFDPEILKRYVNFMNNPDERTAVDQFGKGDKYFGVCTLMVTMPGLPMLGHGQIEGFAEKYGMEYQRAYWDETPDQYLIERHEREIFPLMHKRYLFANVDDFLLYDFFTPEGGVNENVFAYSNRSGDERSLVVYHNAFASARGWICTSAAYMARTGDGRTLRQKSLGEGLGLNGGDDWFTIFSDDVAGMEYIRSSRELIEQGLYIELGAYKCHVFLDFRQVQDDATQQYRNLAAYLNGRGVPSVEEAIQETFLQPIHYPLRQLINADLFARLTALVTVDAMPADAPERADVDDLPADAPEYADAIDELPELADDLAETAALDGDFGALDTDAEIDDLTALSDDFAELAEFDADEEHSGETLFAEIETKLLAVCAAINAFTGSDGDGKAVTADVLAKLGVILAASDATAPDTNPWMINHERWPVVWAWLFLHALGQLGNETDRAQQSVSWIDEWLLGRLESEVFRALGNDEQQAARQALLVKRMVAHQRWFAMPVVDRSYALLEELLGDTGVQQLLRVNRHQGVLWFSKEQFEEMLGWLQFLADNTLRAEQSADTAAQRSAAAQTITDLQRAGDASGYQVAKLLQAARV